MKDGILVVNKPEGLSSAGVVGRLKRILKVKKIGHTGTLDPFATGVLLIAVGKATRISRFFLDGSKAYRARVTLGVETDTYDCTGRETFRADPGDLAGITEAALSRVVAGFSGVQEQVAPAYSALKHEGQPLYKLARQGKPVQKPPRQIEIHRIAMERLETSPQGLPEFNLDVHCSGGTYIRSLAYDIGKQLGCGAHLSALSRTGSSQFTIDQALALDDIKEMDRPEISARIISMSQCLDFMPAIIADEAAAKKIRHGQTLECQGAGLSTDDHIRIIDGQDDLLAIVRADKSGQTFKYCCVFSS
ncbi:MAG: tRNA pseudouridine(55) synthase TruB [Desulfobacter sp.]|nr:MAG: tRNA pseudouridine(55) synthase TruB [Desulfobacter sp.]